MQNARDDFEQRKTKTNKNNPYKSLVIFLNKRKQKNSTQNSHDVSEQRNTKTNKNNPYKTHVIFLKNFQLIFSVRFFTCAFFQVHENAFDTYSATQIYRKLIKYLYFIFNYCQYDKNRYMKNLIKMRQNEQTIRKMQYMWSYT